MTHIRLEPVYQNYVWGGEKIPKYFRRELPLGKYAESWEVSDRAEGMSCVGSGPFRGRSFREWLSMHAGMERQFPLVVKILDARESLSVQVHPDEAAARELGGEPKSEAWIALEKSVVYAGLKEGVSRQQFVRAREIGEIERLLHRVVLEKGDAIYIPAGQIHAIAAGSFLLEVQQNSNTTYRLYDWGRKGREIHWEKGIIAAHWDGRVLKKEKPKIVGQITELVASPYFTIQRFKIHDFLRISIAPYQILFCVEGEPFIENEKVFPGMTYLFSGETSDVCIRESSEWISISPM